MMKEDIRLTMKAAMMYERISGKNFTGISDDIEDIDMLIYCAFVCSTNIMMTKQAFDTMIASDEKLMEDIAYKFARMNEFSMQFSRKKDQETGGGAENVDFSITDAMNTLIFDYGLDADYVLNKMDLWEIECLYKGAEEHFHNQMEDKRLWAYINMLPHIDKKHARTFTPSKMMEFPWEKEKNKENAARQLEIEKEKMKNIIGLNIDEIIANGKRGTDDSAGSTGAGGSNEETEPTVGVRETGSGEQGT